MKATQGTWDPSARGAFFTAGGWQDGVMMEHTVRFQPSGYNLFAVNDFAEPGETIRRDRWSFTQFLKSIDKGCATFLDSGIFYLTNKHKRAHGTTMDQALALAPEEIDHFDWLWDIYGELCSEFGDDLWGYNELDQGGRDNKIRTRARLEAEGLRPIPVYHPLNDGWSYFDELAQEYDRICWGNLVQAPRAVRRRLLATAFERHRSYPDLYVHFLGLTPNEIQAGLPFDSADSSAWTTMLRYAASVRFSAMGRRPFPADRAAWPPLTGDLEDQNEGRAFRYKAGETAVIDAVSMARGLRHWHAEVSAAFNLPRYPPPEATP